MSLAIPTGRKEERACWLCGVVVLHTEQEVFGATGAQFWWSKARHTSPCGLPCLGGGVDAKVLRESRVAGKRLHQVVHGSSAGACTACGFVAPDL